MPDPASNLRQTSRPDSFQKGKLSLRQRQMLDLLLGRDGRCDQPTLLKLMWMRWGVGTSQSADLLGRLSDKGVIRLERRTERTTDWKGVTHAQHISEWVVV